MNSFDSELENELRELRPAAPSAELATAIDRRLAEPRVAPWPAKALALLWASWSLTAAALFAVVLAWWPADGRAVETSTVDVPSSAADRRAVGQEIVPVATTNVLTDASDEGLVLLADGRPARRLRLRYVDTLQLRDAGAQADIAVSRPREEIRFVPVDFY